MTNQESWLQAQYSVLGSVLIDSDLAPKVIQQTRASDFQGECKTVYSAMMKLFQDGTPVDPVTVAHALGPAYRDLIRQLMEVTPSAANVDSYIQICREQAKVVSIRGIAEKLLIAENSDAVQKLLEEANALMVEKPSLRIVTMAEALKSFFERHTGDVEYLTWPISALNDRLYSEPGDFIIIGGYPSTGKSAWSLQCAQHWAKRMKVGFFSLETGDKKMFDRIMSSIADLTMDDIKRNQITEAQWNHIIELSPGITAQDLELIPAAGMTPADIRSVTMMKGYKLIIIDYVQLVIASGANRTEQVTNISMALHRMAQDMGVTVVALSQLKRKDSDSTPESSDLRESGQLEQDADLIMTLKLEKKEDPGGNRKLYITKNKEGTCFMTTLAFDGKHQTFTKALQTGQTISKLIADGKKAQRRAGEAALIDSFQMSMLPKDTEVPFN